MLLAEPVIPLVSSTTLNEINNLVEQNLLGEWVVRIEHSGEPATGNQDWQQWRAALFALKNAEPVINAILACRANSPNHAIRLHAEKLRPQTRFIYWVHSPA